MNIIELKKELVLKHNILIDSEIIIRYLRHKIIWDNSIVSRKTASFGIPYNYSGINYQQRDMPNTFNDLVKIVESVSGFKPNNCLVNFYYNGVSKMGFHSDQTDILENGTCIVIFSFGSTRILRFKNKINRDIIYDIPLECNSFFSMSQNVQSEWLHSVLPDNFNNNERYSITFRKIIM